MYIFQVYLYDNPDPDSGYRPWLTPVERIQGEVSVFLGIPYARPPVLEGRFKVRLFLKDTVTMCVCCVCVHTKNVNEPLEMEMCINH